MTIIAGMIISSMALEWSLAILVVFPPFEACHYGETIVGVD
jgi:hypothetical protein